MATSLVQVALAVLVTCLWVSQLCQAYKLVDLTHAQEPKSTYWPALKAMPGWQREHILRDKNEKGVWFEVGKYSSGEHGGTHVDVPYHFNPLGMDLKDYPLSRTMAEGVLLDFSVEGKDNMDFAVTKDMLQKWETKNGRIPDKSAVLFKFGYASKFWDPKKYFNTDDINDGSSYHFPHLKGEAAQWLLDSRKVMMVGTDVPSPDKPTDQTYPVHQVLLPKNVMILENVNVRDDLPTRGFRLHAAPIRVKNGTGIQTRIYAMLEDSAREGSMSGSDWLAARAHQQGSLIACLLAMSAAVRVIASS